MHGQIPTSLPAEVDLAIDHNVTICTLSRLLEGNLLSIKTFELMMSLIDFAVLTKK